MNFREIDELGKTISDADILDILSNAASAPEGPIQPTDAPTANNTTPATDAPAKPLDAPETVQSAPAQSSPVSPTTPQGSAMAAIKQGMKEGRAAPRPATMPAPDGQERHAGDGRRTDCTNPKQAPTASAQTLSTTKPKQVKQVPKLDVITAAELDKLEIPPLKFLVDGFIVHGDFLVLASAPKVGKSWMMLDLALSIAEGGKFLGCQTHKAGVLYCDLEERRPLIKRRLRKLRGDAPKPDNCYIVNSVPKLGEGLLDALGAELDSHPDIALVIVDVIQRIKDTDGKESGTLYATDTGFLAPLKDFAEQRGITFIAVHHTRKADSNDKFEKVSGSTAMTSVGDGTILIERQRGTTQAKLSYEGRSLESIEWCIEFDKATCRWVNLGDADAYAERELAKAYEANPTVHAIRELTKDKGFDGWTGTPLEFMEKGREITGHEIAPTSQALGKLLRALQGRLREVDGIGIKFNPRNGSKGRTFTIYRTAKPEPDETDTDAEAGEPEAVQGTIDWTATIDDE